MNTIATFLWGSWEQDRGLAYLYTLQDSVAKHCSVPYRFVCFTDRPLAAMRLGIETVPLNVDEIPGVMKKMVAFRPCSKMTGTILALDLDTVIVDSLDPIFEIKLEENTIITCEDIYSRGKIGGGVHLFREGFGMNEFWRPICRQLLAYSDRCGGSERYFMRVRAKELGSDLDLRYWQAIKPAPVVSYKGACEAGVPPGARMIWFHGIPRPHQTCEVEWVQRAWGITYQGYSHDV